MQMLSLIRQMSKLKKWMIATPKRKLQKDPARNPEVADQTVKTMIMMMKMVVVS